MAKSLGANRPSAALLAMRIASHDLREIETIASALHSARAKAPRGRESAPLGKRAQRSRVRERNAGVLRAATANSVGASRPSAGLMTRRIASRGLRETETRANALHSARAGAPRERESVPLGKRAPRRRAGGRSAGVLRAAMVRSVGASRPGAELMARRIASREANGSGRPANAQPLLRVRRPRAKGNVLPGGRERKKARPSGHNGNRAQRKERNGRSGLGLSFGGGRTVKRMGGSKGRTASRTRSARFKEMAAKRQEQRGDARSSSRPETGRRPRRGGKAEGFREAVLQETRARGIHRQGRQALQAPRGRLSTRAARGRPWQAKAKD